jgi:hypothetical protein
MSDVAIAVLITVATIVALILWVPCLILLDRQLRTATSMMMPSRSLPNAEAGKDTIQDVIRSGCAG